MKTIIALLTTFSVLNVSAAEMNLICSQLAKDTYISLNTEFGSQADVDTISGYKITVGKTYPTNGISITATKGKNSYAAAGTLESKDSSVAIYISNQKNFFDVVCRLAD